MSHADAALSAGTADTVLVGARVLTPDGRPADAVAVRDGVIVFAGPQRDARRLTGPGTRVIRLPESGLVVPGFQDAHCHPPTAGLAMGQADLHDADDQDAYLAIIARYAAAHPDAEWVVGDGWTMSAFPVGTPPALRWTRSSRTAPSTPRAGTATAPG